MIKKELLPGMGTHQEPEWTVWLTVVIALVLGLLLQTVVTGQMAAASAGGTTVSYPASWVKLSEPGALFAATDLNAGGMFAPRVVVRQVARRDLASQSDATLNDAAGAWSFNRGAELIAYRSLSTRAATVHGREAIQIEYAYLMDSPQGGAGVMPGLMRAVDTLVASGDQIYILTFAANSNQFAQLGDLHQRLLDSWRVP